MSDNRYSIKIGDRISATNKSDPQKVIEGFSSMSEIDLSKVEARASQHEKKSDSLLHRK